MVPRRLATRVLGSKGIRAAGAVALPPDWEEASLLPIFKERALAGMPSENRLVGNELANEVRSSPRPISTARLHALLRFDLRPINHVIFVGSYLVNPVGELIFRWASNLDAFSFYPLRTQLPGICYWRNNPYTGGPSVPVLSY